MTIKYSNNIISIEALEINNFIATPANYTGVVITTNINCTTDSKVSISKTDIVDNTKNIYIANNILYIKPAYFSGINFINGIYRIVVEFTTTTGYIIIQNCYFVDYNMACKVSSLLQNILKENEDSNIEPVSTIAHILHYSLVNGSNCGCNCNEMCDVFTALQELLYNVDTKLVNDCGC